MRKYIMLALLCLLVCEPTPGKIRNGYEVDIKKARSALNNLQSILDACQQYIPSSRRLSHSQKKKIKTKIAWLHEYVACYELTERLLKQFKLIGPDLYNQIDTIKDANNRPVDVYVKFIPEDQMPLGVVGSTNLYQSAEDVNTYSSEYGDYTVSVKIAIQNNSLRWLAHELGHVRYQVPNLLSYMVYYRKHYDHVKSGLRGHHSKDPSGQQAYQYERMFNERYRSFHDQMERSISSPMALFEDVRRAVLQSAHQKDELFTQFDKSIWFETL